MKFATAAYVLFLALIVCLADRGDLNRHVSWVTAVPFGDKAGHFVLMGILSFLVNMVLKIRTFKVFGRHMQLGSLLVFLVVLIEECSQIFLPHRTFCLVDLSCDIAGIWLFGWIAKLAYGMQQNSNLNS